MPPPDVIVIGAGLAGLSAAVELTRRGARVLVLEARPGLGGRATAFIDPDTGETVDNGQHVLFGCYHETFRFLRAIGTESLVQLDPSLAIDFIDTAGRCSRLRTGSWPPPWHLLAGVLTWEALTWRDRFSAFRLAPALRRAGRSPESTRRDEADGETVEEWLMRHRQTPRLREMLWEPLAVAALNQPPDVARASPFLRVIGRMFTGSRRDAAIGLPKVPLDALYARPAAEWIRARGGEVRANAAARVVCVGDRVSHVDVRDERLDAEVVICTVPWHALETTIDPMPAALAEIGRRAGAMASSPIVTVNLWLDRTVTEVPFIGLPGRTMQWAFDKGRVFGEHASHLSLVSSGAEAIVAESNADLVRRAVDETRSALPAAREAEVRRATVVRERRATFSLAPGQPRRPGTTTPIRGLLLAGDWIDTGLPATIESAVISGHRAAALAAKE